MADPLNGFNTGTILDLAMPRGKAMLPEPPTEYPFPVANNNLEAAKAELKLTPQEIEAYKHHLNNAVGPGGVDYYEEIPRPDVASRATYLMTPYTKDGRHYALPGVADGKTLSYDETIARAEKIGLDKFPVYATRQELLDRYDKIHGYFDKDLTEIAKAQGGGRQEQEPEPAPQKSPLEQLLLKIIRMSGGQSP